TFADPSVLSVTLAVGVDKRSSLIAMETLLDLNQMEFANLSVEPQVVVMLPRWGDLGFKLSQRNVFYEQSAALGFFLRSGRGDEGRRALVEYLRLFYLRRQVPESWKVLGFKTADELQTAFTTWLRALK